MELPPNPGGDKGFITEGADVLHGKRKSTLTDAESVKAQRLESLAFAEARKTEARRQFHARRASTPESFAKQTVDAGTGNPDQRLYRGPPGAPRALLHYWEEAPGDDQRRNIHLEWLGPSRDWFYKGPGPWYK